MLEMTSLIGNITKDKAGEVSLRAHAVFSYLNEHQWLTSTAGHLKKAIINYTSEIVIHPIDGEITHQWTGKVKKNRYKVKDFDNFAIQIALD